jgi:hypothetical protein
MFKITGRIVLILIAASLVAGVLYLLVNGVAGQPGLLSSLDRRGGFGGGLRGAANEQPASRVFLAQGVSNLTLRSDFGAGGFRERISLGRGLAGVVSNLIIVTLITVLVVLVHGAIKKALGRPLVKTP